MGQREMANALDKLESETKQPTGGVQYADWWKPANDGEPEQLLGVVYEIHESQYNEDSPFKPVLSVRSLGEGGYEKGVERSTLPHVQMVQGIEENNVQLGDLVNVKYTGMDILGEKNNSTHTYEFGAVSKSDWIDMDDSDLLDEVLEMNGGVQDDSRNESGGATVGDASSAIDASGGGGDTPDISNQEDPETDEFIESVLDMQNGSMLLGQLDQLVNDTRSMGVDLEAKADVLGYTLEENDDGETIVSR